LRNCYVYSHIKRTVGFLPPMYIVMMLHDKRMQVIKGGGQARREVGRDFFDCPVSFPGGIPGQSLMITAFRPETMKLTKRFCRGSRGGFSKRTPLAAGGKKVISWQVL
jgi:hypothetical protein